VKLLPIILTLALAGFVLWLVHAFVPMDPWIARLLDIAVVIVLVLWLLRVTGLLAMMNTGEGP
jgi:hypothetical protein